jgi:hypothetical protein
LLAARLGAARRGFTAGLRLVERRTVVFFLTVGRDAERALVAGFRLVERRTVVFFAVA